MSSRKTDAFPVEWLLLVALCIVGGAAHAEPLPQLEFRLAVLRAEVVQYEPVVVSIEIRNLTDHTLRYVDNLDPETGGVTYTLIDGNGQTHVYDPPVHASVVAFWKPLQPGESVIQRRLLFRLCDDWPVITRETGSFQIRARYAAVSPEDNMGLRLESPPVTLKVVAPKGNDALAAERFRGVPQMEFAEGWTMDRTIEGEFHAVVQRYPESVFAPWSLYFLACSQAHRDPKTDPRPLTARDDFERLLQKYPDFSLALEARYASAMALHRMGRSEEAAREVHDLVATNPNIRFLQKVKAEMDARTERGLPPLYGAQP